MFRFAQHDSAIYEIVLNSSATETREFLGDICVTEPSPQPSPFRRERREFVEKQFHFSTAASTRSFASSRKATTCSRRRLGNLRGNPRSNRRLRDNRSNSGSARGYRRSKAHRS